MSRNTRGVKPGIAIAGLDRRGVAVLSGGDIKFGSQWDIAGCENGGNVTLAFGDLVFRLVN